jgi:hypothetical protein
MCFHNCGICVTSHLKKEKIVQVLGAIPANVATCSGLNPNMSTVVDSTLCTGKLRQCLFSSLLEKTIFHIRSLTSKICMKLAHICRLEYQVGSWSSIHFQVWYKPRLKMQLSLNSAHMEKEISDEFHSFHSTFTKPNSNDNKVLEPKEKCTKIVHFH